MKTLEPYEGKLSCTVPGGERRSNPPDLPNITETPGFSPFVITGKTTGKTTEFKILAEIPPEPDTQTLKQSSGYTGSDIKKKTEYTGNVQAENKKTGNTSTYWKENVSLPGFEIISGIVCLLGVLLYRRK